MTRRILAKFALALAVVTLTALPGRAAPIPVGTIVNGTNGITITATVLNVSGTTAVLDLSIAPNNPNIGQPPGFNGAVTNINNTSGNPVVLPTAINTLLTSPPFPSDVIVQYTVPPGGFTPTNPLTIALDPVASSGIFQLTDSSGTSTLDYFFNSLTAMDSTTNPLQHSLTLFGATVLDPLSPTGTSFYDYSAFQNGGTFTSSLSNSNNPNSLIAFLANPVDGSSYSLFSNSLTAFATPVSTVPEPASVLLLCTGVSGLALAGLRKRQRVAS